MSDFNSSLQSSVSEQGKAYLAKMEGLALDPSLVDLRLSPQWQEQIYGAIALQISTINEELESHLTLCQQCFHPPQRLAVQVFAVPFAQHLNIDALCNLKTNPITILIDVGRIVREDWLCAIAHEYAHAQVGVPGHHQAFLKTLTHLCLGLGLTPPPPSGLPESELRNWPPCQPTTDPLAFWLGESGGN
ncbi:hypothetical protein [Halothece sp. PCC 7418]|uniref:hypothetical protein n=1 Tax=Halothece sp. (strain PCC 7418) TaxID=65093 RepID=UPI0002F155DA|nr:hypothetical protein [Halothece sp. PCC 7418]